MGLLLSSERHFCFYGFDNEVRSRQSVSVYTVFWFCYLREQKLSQQRVSINIWQRISPCEWSILWRR